MKMPEAKRIANYTMRNWLESTESILGVNGLKSVLNHSNLQKYIDNFPPPDYEFQIPEEDVKKLFNSLMELFGQKGTRNLQLQMGREMVKIALEKYNKKIVKALLLAARLVPETKKMRLGLDRYKEEYEQAFPDSVDLQEDDDYFLVIQKVNLVSEGVTSQVPVCGVYVGTIEYFMEWITGHKHKVEEIECKAMGYPADVFRVAKARQEET
jgi:predicted hydrocarbon binding protein